MKCLLVNMSHRQQHSRKVQCGRKFTCQLNSPRGPILVTRPLLSTKILSYIGDMGGGGVAGREEGGGEDGGGEEEREERSLEMPMPPK